MTKTEEIKQLMLFLMLGGKEIKEEQLVHMFTILADLSDLSYENDFVDVGINYTTIFVDKSLKLFSEELYDDWIDFFFGELEKNEEYELLMELKL